MKYINRRRIQNLVRRLKPFNYFRNALLRCLTWFRIRLWLPFMIRVKLTKVLSFEKGNLKVSFPEVHLVLISGMLLVLLGIFPSIET